MTICSQAGCLINLQHSVRIGLVLENTQNDISQQIPTNIGISLSSLCSFLIIFYSLKMATIYSSSRSSRSSSLGAFSCPKYHFEAAGKEFIFLISFMSINTCLLSSCFFFSSFLAAFFNFSSNYSSSVNPPSSTKKASRRIARKRFKRIKLPKKIQAIRNKDTPYGQNVLVLFLFITNKIDYQFSMVSTWKIVKKAQENLSQLLLGKPSGSSCQ